MLQVGIRPNRVVFLSIVSACTANAAICIGRLVHFLSVTTLSFLQDVILGTALIHMYGKSRCFADAVRVFDALEDRDTITWNSLISVYARSEEFRFAAVQSYTQMAQEGILADKATFVNLFSSLSCKETLSYGQFLHSVVYDMGLHGDLIVTTAILGMYCKCNLLEDTQKMFDNASAHDSVSWNTLIEAYMRSGQRQKALCLFKEMQRGGIKPDKVSFLVILEAFSGEDCLTEAKSMHDFITCSGFETDVVVGTALINMYSRCGSTEDAKTMFDKMPQQNEFTWNSMIAAYAQNGQGHKAIQLFRKMQREGIKPDKFSLLSMVNACANEFEIQDIWCTITGTCLETDDKIGSAVIHMHSKRGNLEDSYRVFRQFPRKDIVIWNAVIAASARNGGTVLAFQIFEEMKLQAILPDKISLTSILEAPKSEIAVAAGKRVHSMIVAAALEADVVVATALVNMYVNCDNLEDAKSIFMNIPIKDVISWTAVINAYCQCSKLCEAFELFIEMQEHGFEPDKVTFISIISACTTSEEGNHIHRLIAENGLESNVVVANALLNMYCKFDCKEDALRIFDVIDDCDSVAYLSIISACANWSAFSEGKHIHESIMCTEVEVDINVGNALIHFYGKCGSLIDAQVMFDKMHNRDIVTWSVLIAAHAHHGQGQAAITLLDRMRHDGIQPNEITFVNTLSACSHDGLVDDACRCFFLMDHIYGLVPVEDHYDCLIDLFSRAGRLEEAESLMKMMPFPSSAVSWTSFLNACKHMVDVERREYAAELLLYHDLQHPALYVILSNLYSVAA